MSKKIFQWRNENYGVEVAIYDRLDGITCFINAKEYFVCRHGQIEILPANELHGDSSWEWLIAKNIGANSRIYMTKNFCTNICTGDCRRDEQYNYVIKEAFNEFSYFCKVVVPQKMIEAADNMKKLTESFKITTKTAEETIKGATVRCKQVAHEMKRGDMSSKQLMAEENERAKEALKEARRIISQLERFLNTIEN